MKIIKSLLNIESRGRLGVLPIAHSQVHSPLKVRWYTEMQYASLHRITVHWDIERCIVVTPQLHPAVVITSSYGQ